MSHSQRTLAAIALLLLAGCSADPVSTAQTDNSEVPVSLLFTHDGCRVYRFDDAGRWHYFTDCRGSVVSTWTESCGKGCTRHVENEISTGTRP